MRVAGRGATSAAAICTPVTVAAAALPTYLHYWRIYRQRQGTKLSSWVLERRENQCEGKVYVGGQYGKPYCQLPLDI